MNGNWIEFEAVPKAVIRAAEDAMSGVDPDASDEAIAEIVANYLTLPLSGSRFFHLSIFHDVRPSALARMNRLWKHDPGNAPKHQRIGPCPLP
jgi:hypothetical protein